MEVLGIRLRRFDLAVALALASLSGVYVALALTPSHFAEALEALGYSDVGLVLGRSRSIRADDYFVATSLMRSAVLNGFDPIASVSPYHESLKTFIALPLADWGLALKPQMWAFFVLPPAHALSVYFLCFYLSSVVGYSLLLRRLGAAPTVALIVAVTLLFSQLPQVWWTQRAPAFALAPWPFLILLTRWRWVLRVPALAYTTAVWQMGDFYPPAILSMGFGLAVLVLAFAPRDEGATVPRVASGVAAMALGSGLVALYLGDLVLVMADTVYPGQRMSDGGGVPALMILAHLYPHAASAGYAPAVAGLNACEAGVIGTFLPLLVLLFADYASVVEWFRRNRSSALIWIAGLSLMLAWMTLPIPALLGRVFLWDRVPGMRMLWGFGALLTLGLGTIASRIRFRAGWTRVALFVLLVVASSVASKALGVQPGSEAYDLALPAASIVGWADLAILVPIAVVALAAGSSVAWTEARTRELLLLAGMLHVLFAFGGFNPLQSAHAIFRRDSSPLLEAIRAIGAAHPQGWAAVPGFYGGALNAFGVRSLNHVLPTPQLAFFRKLYPEMPEAEFLTVFNRYAHVIPTFDAMPSNPQGDVVTVPIFDVATPIGVSAGSAHESSAAPESGGGIDALDVLPAGPGRFRVVGIGWAPFRGIEPDQSLSVSFGRADVESIRAVRMPRLDVGRALGDAAFDTSGFAFEALVSAADAAVLRSELSVTATDPGGRRHRLRRAD